MTSQPEHVAVVFEPDPERALARVSGAIGMDEAPALREELTVALPATRAGPAIDLTGATFCDSSGLHLLLDVNQLAVQAGNTIVLTALSSPVARLLHLSGIERVLTVHAPVLWVKHRRYGPTAHLTPIGQLNETTRWALDEVQAVLKDVDVVACDMQELTLLDVTGLNALIDFARRLNENGIVFFVYNGQPQPRGLLDLIEPRHES
ncbi:hypothetical protein GCM10010302_06850 [Streptomyces polychromogenes]|uniref:STAS domain-containing protein n=1 Tax=Streptomyces polychromogenes TaxID=67342 RepID=A0ABP3ER73_9ACTN